MTERASRVRVFCTKPMTFIHFHPHLMEVPGQTDKPHLSQPHEHRVHVTASMLCEHLERDKDLLLLHAKLENATEWPRRVQMGERSFEQIADQLRAAMEYKGTGKCIIHSIKIDAGDEGTEIVWFDQLDAAFPASAFPVPEFLKRKQS